MEQLKFLADLFLHLDEYMANIINQYGTWTYAILFLVIFMETGFVVTPFLPGDSLLFAAGTFAALGSLNVWLLIVLLIVWRAARARGPPSPRPFRDSSMARTRRRAGRGAGRM